MRTTAVIGAGVAGMVCARMLADAGRSVVLFDKGRKPGGRLSTRYAADATFDHGAPMLTATSETFCAEVGRWVEAGVVVPWRGRFVDVAAGDRRQWSTDVWVGTPTMSALSRSLAAGLDIRCPVRIGALRRLGTAWSVVDDHDNPVGTFDTVVVNVPSGQARALLDQHLPPVSWPETEAEMDPCWAAMVLTDEAWDPGFDAAAFDSGPLLRAFQQRSKPGRPSEPAWVLHAAPAWTRAHWDDEPEAVADVLAQALGAPAYRFVAAHRWRYARVRSGMSGRCVWNPEQGLGICGDWCGGPGIEGAWYSGRALASQLLG